MSKYIATPHVATALKDRLTREFPGVRFRVTTATGGNSVIRVNYEDGPAASAVRRITSEYEGLCWNGVQHEATGSTLTVTLDHEEVTGEPLCAGVDIQRFISLSAIQEARHLWTEATGEDYDEAGFTDPLAIKGRDVPAGYPTRQIAFIAREIVLVDRWQTSLRARREDAKAADSPQPPAADKDLVPAEQGAPQAYRGVPVPEHLAAAWDTASASIWRDGVDAALTYAALAKS
ncbi:LPD29 domain-containing protein [Streptomyces sp. NRRL B-1347]|uniref:LPD29 domain-containing protein n=1 Tax=Streptomyces sp. NRRL B-1347 TaxID=1476877 RepID=UPI0004C4A885|nr:LPD29 domain-containing protein [Streptomyces sp. NRRL B-1347]